MKLAIRLGDGLECAGGSKPTIDIGTVPAGQTRQVTLPCMARAAGKQKCDVTAEGDGLKASRHHVGSRAPARCSTWRSTGPKMRYLDRKAAYTVKVDQPRRCARDRRLGV